MDGRHHHAVQIVFVETPTAGSPAPLNQAKPPRYPPSRPAPWRPQQTIPSKAAATLRLLDAIGCNEAAARSLLTPQALRRG
jgi:hypothetical protein